MSKDGGPAFPQAHPRMNGLEVTGGMTLRDYFAAAALTGMCANADISTHAAKQELSPKAVQISFAESAYAQADEMLKARGE